MNKKAVLLRSVSALATAAASTTGGMNPAAAQVLSATTDGYYYSVTGGMKLTKSERFLAGVEDKIGIDGPGLESGYSSYYDSNFSSYTYWSSFNDSESSGLSDFAGMFGSVSFGKQLAPSWDVRGTVSLVNGGSDSGWAEAYSYTESYSRASGYYGSGYFSGYAYGSSYSSSYAAGTFSFGYATGDLEFGYTPILNESFGVRLFSGLRGMVFTTKFDGYASEYGYASSYFREDYYPSGYGYGSSYSGFGNSFSGIAETTFYAVGPRLGAQASTKFEGTNFGISGSLAGSVLFGKQKTTLDGYVQRSGYSYYSGYSTRYGSDSGSSYYYSGQYISESTETNKTVLDLEASVGLDYYLTDSAALTIGYQVEKLMEIDGDDNGPLGEIDTLNHGAFVKLSGTF